MQFIIDSHTLIWAADDPAKLPAKSLRLLLDPIHIRLVSVASVWEIAIKFGKGRLPLSLPFRPWIDKAIADLCLTILPIRLDHAERQTSLPAHHGDPFDRMLVAQSLVENIPLVSIDTIFDAYGVHRIWN